MTDKEYWLDWIKCTLVLHRVMPRLIDPSLMEALQHIAEDINHNLNSHQPREVTKTLLGCILMGMSIEEELRKKL